MSWLLLTHRRTFHSEADICCSLRENGQRSQSSFQSEANLQLLPNRERQVHHDNSTVSIHFTSLVTVGFMSYCPLFVEASELSCKTNTFGPAAVDSSLTEVGTTFVI